jgi:hypothetical protein
MEKLIARDAEGCGGGEGYDDDCGRGLKCVGGWSEVGDSRVLKVRECEHPPCVDDQHQRG